MQEFISETVLPPFKELRKELAKHGREAEIDREKKMATLTVYHNEEEEFSYTIRAHAYIKRSSAFPEIGKDFPLVCLAQVTVRDAAQKEVTIDKFTRETIITDILTEYEKWRGW